MLFLAIGLFGWREPAGEATPNDAATLCKSRAIFTTMQGRDSRSTVRKTPAPGVPQMDIPLKNAFDFAGSTGAALLAEPTERAAGIRLGGSIRERAPPAAV